MNKVQKKVKDFCKEHELEHSIENHMLDFVSEAGEVAKEILKMTDYGRKDLEYRKEIESELGDVLYSLITIANYFDIDLEKSVDIVLEKYEKRLEKGNLDSENDKALSRLFRNVIPTSHLEISYLMKFNCLKRPFDL